MTVQTIKPVHGINDDGETTVNALGQFMALISGGDLISSPFERPKRNIFTGNIEKYIYRDAKNLLEDSPSGAHVLAHSQGCQVAAIASSFRKAEFGTMIFIMPALRKDFIFNADGFDKLVVLHNPFDSAVFLTKWIKKLSDWGEMGRLGSDWLEDHPDKGENVAVPYEAKGNDHSFFFEDEHIHMWAEDLLVRL